MNAVKLEAADLDQLMVLAKDLNFDDEERRCALLENASRDFNAVPGSGKTSLLAVKLLLLAKKWPHTRRGICVLSHTNVARNEIEKRLAENSEGVQLLNYPHFIGTIHAFVNQFFALPMLRSLNQKIDVIDDDVFISKFKSLFQHKQFNTLRKYLGYRSYDIDKIIASLFYQNAELDLKINFGKKPPSQTTKSYQSLILIKKMLTEDGFYQHRDMFAYADLALKTCPHLVDIISRRFPMVFIDEMQDTSWEQENFLNQLFDGDGKSVMQRFGDVDQKIFSDGQNDKNLTFPRPGYGCISTSKRFGSAIAMAVGSVRLSKNEVIGEGADTHQPILLLYATENVEKVLPYFDELVIKRITIDKTKKHNIKAMCARKEGKSDEKPGRHLVDYWPAYAQNQQRTHTSLENFWALIGDTPKTLLESSLHAHVLNVRKALLLILREVKSTLVEDVRNVYALPRAIREFGITKPIERLTHYLAISGERLCDIDQHNSIIQHIYDELKPYFPEELKIEKFSFLNAFKEQQKIMDLAASPQNCNFGFELGTIASMKGETHLASLVLESHGGNSKKFDVALGLKYIAGIESKKINKLSETQQYQMRNLYVAMSRPTTLLCLAANEERVPQKVQTALKDKGWYIEKVK